MLQAAIPTGSCVNEPLLCDATPVADLPIMVAQRRGKPAAARTSDSALRVTPLSDFAWSGLRGLPRTRRDHVVVWVRAGAAVVQLPRRSVEAGAGSLQYLPAGTAFAFNPALEAAGTVILIPRDFPVGALPRSPAHVQLPPDSASLLEGSIAALAGASLSRSACAEPLDRIMTMVRQPVASPVAASPAEGSTLAARFASLAARQLGSGSTIGDMADILGCTAATLDRACRSLHGTTALDLLAQLRLAHAQKLLRTTRCPLRLIAHQAGFSSEAHLGRALAAAHRQLATSICVSD